MKRFLICMLALVPACAVELSDTSETSDDLDANGGHGRDEPSDAGIQHIRGAKPGGGGGSPLLVYHGGTVMTTGAAVQPIFWGPS